MKVARKLLFVSTCIIMIVFNHTSFGGLGDGTSESANPTGGIGTGGTNGSSSNPVGGFGGGEDLMPLGPPPPPPEPIPLDGGVFTVIIAGLGLGARKIYKGVKAK